MATTGTYADVNGISLYYETHGTGTPLILLHGGLGSGEMFAPMLARPRSRERLLGMVAKGLQTANDDLERLIAAG